MTAKGQVLGVKEKFKNNRRKCPKRQKAGWMIVQNSGHHHHQKIVSIVEEFFGLRNSSNLCFLSALGKYLRNKKCQGIFL